MNIEIFMPWEDGGERYCAALMATSNGTVKIGQQSVPYLVPQQPRAIPRVSDQAFRTMRTDVDERQTELTSDQARILADALEGDNERAMELVPLGIQVVSDIDQWFDLPHEFMDYDPNTFSCDVMWMDAPTGLSCALRDLADISQLFSELDQRNLRAAEELMNWARSVVFMSPSYKAFPCVDQRENCYCRNTIQMG